MLLSIPSVVFV